MGKSKDKTKVIAENDQKIAELVQQILQRQKAVLKKRKAVAEKKESCFTLDSAAAMDAEEFCLNFNPATKSRLSQILEHLKTAQKTVEEALNQLNEEGVVEISTEMQTNIHTVATGIRDGVDDEFKKCKPFEGLFNFEQSTADFEKAYKQDITNLINEANASKNT